ncbi:MAG: tetratricopeptide repeat protein [Pyrinomonadaceae bacterium]|nr:tetratricopeptide repeat protein [Pyrinomonadaceae bacterium]MBP6212295.1 tetratricopeptide repeat protein [Pyrinomonadaceae bacterium]
MRHFLTTISLFSAVLFSVGILSSSALAQNPPTPAAVDANAILGLWEGIATWDKVAGTTSFRLSRVNGALTAVMLYDQNRNLESSDISLSPDGTIVIKYIIDSATSSNFTFSGKVDPAANKMGGTVVLLGNNQRFTGTWQATRKPVADAVSDKSRFKQIILDIAMGKSVPEADKTWADNYEKQNMPAKASVKVAETVDQKKARAWPLFQKAVADYNASNFVGAINGFTEYLKILPDAIDARLNRGFAHNKLGQSELALADFEYVLKIKPDEPYALDEAARTRAKLPRKVETLTSIFQVTDMKVTDAGYRELQSLIERYGIAGLTTDRKFEPYLTLTIDAYEMLTANGVKTLRQMAPAADISDARFAELFGLNCPKPKVTAGTLNSGEVVNGLKCTFGPSTMKAISPEKRIDRSSFAVLLNQALNHGTEKLKLNSRLDDSKTGPITKANAASAKELVDRGLGLIGKKDYEGAIRLFNQVVDTNPEYVDAYRFRAIAALLIYEQSPAMQGQKLFTALSNFDEAINRGSTKPDDFYMRGQTHEKLGHKNDAIADYRKALSIDSNLQKAKDALKRLGATP